MINYEYQGTGYNVVRKGRPVESWNMDLPQLPVGVHGCYVTHHDRRIYVVGGTSDQGHTNLIQRYDIDTGCWHTWPLLPWHHRLMVGASTRYGIFVFFDGSYCLFHPETNQIEGPFPVPCLEGYVQAGKAIVLGESIILIGGLWTTGAYTSRNVVRFDPGSRTASLMAPLQVGRAHPEAVVHGDNLYVCGGRIDYTTTNLPESCADTMERYDAKTDSWHLLCVRMPLPRMVHTIVAAGRHALMFDGQPRSDALQMSSVFVFDLESETFLDNNWVSPYATWSGGSAYVDGRIYLVGGNQLAYYKPAPETFVMRHMISRRLVCFQPILPPSTDDGPCLPQHVY
jgi:hypothetical protein